LASASQAAAVDEIEVTPDSNLESLAGLAPESSTFRFAPGEYRGVSVTPKAGQRFIGALGKAGERLTILRGSKVVTGFERTEDGLWFAGAELEARRPHGECDEDPLCGSPYQLFAEGLLLKQVAELAELEEGAWMPEPGANRVWLGMAPGARRIELSDREFAFRGPADGVVVENLIIEHYASSAQHGAIDTQSSNRRADPQGHGWQVLNNEIAWSHGVGVRVSDGAVVRGNEVHHNGQLGIKGSGSGIVIDRNRIHDNHHGGFRRAWEAGGIKLTRTRGARVTKNIVSENDGTGIWLDIDTDDSLVRDNEVAANSRVGVHIEISTRATVERNLVVGNGLGRPDWGWGAGILVANSSSVRVLRNTLKNNADGIVAIDQVREEGPHEMRNVFSLEVAENCVTQEGGFAAGVLEDHENADVFCCRANVFKENRYQLGREAVFAWQGSRVKAERWVELNPTELLSGCK
jgi:parallel beta-helix repeat protein